MGDGHLNCPSTSQDHNEYAIQHLVRYEELIPCTTAFIDTRTPGSKEKENFTIIGPGVAENPDQHVHITRSHGFNIGGARQPPHCINSQHSHETAEVFVVLQGDWVFTTGETGNDGRVALHPGDTISIPTHCFRGFENIGPETGFLFAVLGGDDPGRVTWAPYVFEQARDHGLILLENGSLVDTAAGEKAPAHVKPMPVTSPGQVAAMDVYDTARLERCVVRQAQLAHQASELGGNIEESTIIGQQPTQGELTWPHGFQLNHLRLPPGCQSPCYRRGQEEVFMLFRGQLEIRIRGETFTLGPGDVFTAEIGQPRTLANRAAEPCEAYVVHGSESPDFNLTS